MSFVAGGMILIQSANRYKHREEKIMDMKDMIEELEDIKNIGQMLEVSLQANEDDPNIIRSVSIINRKLAAVIEKARR